MIVEVATVGPGDAVWERFGHVVLRVANTRTGHDDAYDLGAADFGLPGFAWDFANGRERFFTSVSPWSERIERFRARDREIVVQRLALDEIQMQRLRDEVNALRSHADTHFYVYDHVRDNCSTRLRDLLDRVTGGAIRRAAETLESKRTYRELTLAGEAGRIDALLFLDLIVGPPYDRVVSGWDLLFLPIHLGHAVARARIADGRSDRPLVASTSIEHRRRAAPPQDGSPQAGRRLAVGFGLACLALCLAARIAARGRDARLARAFDRAFDRAFGAALAVVGLLFGCAGVALWTLIAISRVPDLSWSENALLFLPVDLVWIGYGWSRVRKTACESKPLPICFCDARLALLAAVAVARAVGALAQDNTAFLICAAAVFIGLRIAGSESARPAL